MLKEMILIVDDEKNTRESLVKILSQDGYSVNAAKNAEDSLVLLKENAFSLVITDLRLPGNDGLYLFRRIKKEYAGVEVILMTAYGTVESAVEAMKEGVYDYLTKPINIDELLLVIHKIFQNRKIFEENKYLKEKLKDKSVSGKIIWKCGRMKEIYDLIKQVATSRSTVLIQGESGTGKELVANEIHYSSNRDSNPFVKISCAAIPEGLLESELFGHEKGSFTSAYDRKKGLFEQAHTGTIFLDEISEMSLPLQSKLLRVLEEKEFQRVGGHEPIKVDVRVISATNKDLSVLVKESKFREDLFYRLNVVNIVLPPLRERYGDLHLLVEYFLNELGRETSRKILGVSDKVMEILENHNWPGNVRELKNCLESAVVRSSGKILEVDNLPSYLRKGSDVPVLDQRTDSLLSLEEIERKTIIHTLKLVEGNKSKASQILGIGLKTLYRKLKKYGIE